MNKFSTATKIVRLAIPKVLVVVVCGLVFASCSQNIDQVEITPRLPNSPVQYFFVGDADHQGGNPQTAVAPSAYMNTETLGGNFTRTNSSSPSFVMTSGIGVD